MSKNTIINLILLGASIMMIYAWLYPNYNGGGLNIFNRSNIIYEIAKSKQLDEVKMLANDLNGVGQEQVNYYNTLPISVRQSIDTAIPNKVDMARIINDIDKLTKRFNLKSVNVNYNKTSSVENPGLYVYELNVPIVGDYRDVRAFIAELESSLQIYNIKTISMTASTAVEDVGKINTSMILQIYEIKQ